jgi:hypothetical protein
MNGLRIAAIVIALVGLRFLFAGTPLFALKRFGQRWGARKTGIVLSLSLLVTAALIFVSAR